MKEDIINNLENPRQLEKLYRDNKANFKAEFNLIFHNIHEHPSAKIWNERLNYENEEISWGSRNELIFVFIVSLIAGLIAKIPDYTAVNPDYFYPRNIAFIVFPMLTAYFSWRQEIPLKKLLPIAAAFLISIIYINLLPNTENSDTLILACIHLPLFLWTILGYSFVGGNLKNDHERINFLRYNGDLVVMTALLLISGGIMTGITIGMFKLINLEIHDFYFNHIVIWGLAAAPILGTYLVRTNPQLVNKVSPIIAKVFTPIVLVTLVIYLIAVIYTRKDPYNDREFLMIFNLLLIGVMALILFSIAETSKQSDSKFGTILLLCLSIVTILINGIALSAILFRISEWGITPNRLAVLGSNTLILTNLVFVAYRLFKLTKDSSEIENVEKAMTRFIPIFSFWTIIVCFLFPIIFRFK